MAIRKTRPDIIRIRPKDTRDILEKEDVCYLYEQFIFDPDSGFARLFVKSGKTVKFVRYDIEDGFVWVMDSIDQKPFKVRRVQIIKPGFPEGSRVA